MSAPLKGIRVIDFTTMIAGPAATRMLADCGAEVIKIETTEGDLLRGRYAASAVSRYVYGMYNAGKRSIILDLKDKSGHDAACDLIATADIVVENFRPGVMERLGLGHEALRIKQPNLVYCSISGFGHSGPLAHRPAFAPVVHAYSGLDKVLSRASQGDLPLTHGVVIADVVAGINAFAAIQTALLHRERNGIGSFVDVTLIESTMQLCALQYQEAQAGVLPEAVFYPPLATLNGYITVPMIAPRAVEQVFRLLGHEDWIDHPKYCGRAGHRLGREEIWPELAAWSAQRTSEECERILAELGIPCAPYKTAADMWSDQQTSHLGSFTEVSDVVGDFKILNTPFRISGTDCSAGRAIEPLGASTDLILSSLVPPPPRRAAVP